MDSHQSPQLEAYDRFFKLSPAERKAMYEEALSLLTDAQRILLEARIKHAIATMPE